MMCRRYGWPLFRLDDHLDRFERSCEKLRLKSPLSREEIRDRLVEMTAKSGIRDAYVMMIVTRGLRFIRQYAPKNARTLLSDGHALSWVMNEETQKAGGSAIIALCSPRTTRCHRPHSQEPAMGRFHPS